MISANEYIERRNNILNEMEASSICILFAGKAPRFSGDAFYNFEVNKNFYYLTGIDQENSILVLVKTFGETNCFLFIDEKNEKVEKWTGIKMSCDEARNISGIQNVLLTKSFDGKLNSILSPEYKIYGDVVNIYLDLEDDLRIFSGIDTHMYRDSLYSLYPNINFTDIHGIACKYRMIKSNAEIEMIEDAIHTTDLALINVLRHLKEAKLEYNIKNIFEFTVKEDLNSSFAFPSIVAAGKNAVILHYPNCNDIINKDDLVLLDVGARKDYYCSDISRTYPISGKFNEVQKLVYEIVLACNKETINFMKPGLTLKEINDFAIEFLTKKCLESHIIEKAEDIRNIYYHSVSHYLGLDTHDCGDKETPLVPGNVVTCEPGLYIKELGIGIRIEDDVLITENGSRILSNCVLKEISQIERLLK